VEREAEDHPQARGGKHPNKQNEKPRRPWIHAPPYNELCDTDIQLG